MARTPPLLDLFCACAPGLEPLLAREVAALGLPAEIGPGGVATRGTLEQLARLNLWLRVAGRVLLRLGSFGATTFPGLVHEAKLLPFERVLRPGQPVAIRATCTRSRLYHSGGVVERVHAAIEARLGGACPLVKPSPDEAEPEQEPGGAGQGGTAPQLILVRLEQDRCTVSADSSGELLHRRGARKLLSQAPLRETLAAALLLSAGYGGGPLLDPCCGAGTIPIEAAWIAARRPPGLARPFALERWPGSDRRVVDRLRDEAHAGLQPIRAPIAGSDADPQAVAAARTNAAAAGVAEQVAFEVAPLDRCRTPAAATGLLAANPPYGKRVGEGPRLRALYGALGQLARDRLAGWDVALLCPEPTLAEPGLAEATGLGLRCAVQTRNGGLRVGFFQSRAALI